MILLINSNNPQDRLIKKAAEILNNNGVIIYPTDSGYALASKLGNKNGLDRIRKIRKLSKNHNFTLMIDNLKNIAMYAKMSNNSFRLLKKITPGAWTIILEATSKIPNFFLHKRKTIGVRIPDHNITQSLLKEMNGAIMSVSLIIDNYTFYDIEDVIAVLDKKVDLIIDGGYCPPMPTTVIDLSGENFKIIRNGAADVSLLK